jgi:sugar phosphate isomerase/epimerase
LKLGRQVQIGEGLANIPEVIRRLKEIGYQGNYIVEREISDNDQQRKDIQASLEMIRANL